MTKQNPTCSSTFFEKNLKILTQIPPKVENMPKILSQFLCIPHVPLEYKITHRVIDGQKSWHFFSISAVKKIVLYETVTKIFLASLV